MSQYIYLPEVAHFNRRLHCGEGRVSVLLGRESSTESSHHKKKKQHLTLNICQTRKTQLLNIMVQETNSCTGLDRP